MGLFFRSIANPVTYGVVAACAAALSLMLATRVARSAYVPAPTQLPLRKKRYRGGRLISHAFSSTPDHAHGHSRCTTCKKKAGYRKSEKLLPRRSAGRRRIQEQTELHFATVTVSSIFAMAVESEWFSLN